MQLQSVNRTHNLSNQFVEYELSHGHSPFIKIGRVSETARPDLVTTLGIIQLIDACAICGVPISLPTMDRLYRSTAATQFGFACKRCGYNCPTALSVLESTADSVPTQDDYEALTNKATKLRESIRDSVEFELNEQWATAVYKTLPHKALASDERFVAAMSVVVIDWLEDCLDMSNMTSLISDNCSWPIVIGPMGKGKASFSTYVPDNSGKAKSVSLVVSVS